MQTSIMAFRGLVHSKYKNEAEMARKLGWPRQRLNKISTGKKEPDVRELNAIAKALDTNIGDLVQFFLPDASPNGQQTE